MYKYHNQLLPSVFNSFFTKVDQVHSYNTRHASKLSYYLPKVRTNYGKFNIRFQGPMIWNSIDEDFKRSSLSLFKLKLKEHLTDNYYLLMKFDNDLITFLTGVFSQIAVDQCSRIIYLICLMLISLFSFVVFNVFVCVYF